MVDNKLSLELGTTTHRRRSRSLYDDFLPQLSGRRALLVYREMSENDGTIGAMLYAIEQLARQVEWTVTPADTPEAEAVTDMLETMAGGWDDFLAAALSEIVYGWSMFEIVYKPHGQGVGWDRFAFRPQASWSDWHTETNGDLKAFVQDTGRGTTVPIPAEKLIHFRTTTALGRLEGMSLLRRAYRSWWFKKNIEDFIGVGIERELNGIPHAEVPLEVLLEKGDEYDEWKKLLNNVRVNSEAGIMTPLEYDDDDRELYRFGLLSSSGRPKVDSRQVWRDFAGDISSIMLAQFIQLGRDAVGSRALAEPQQDMFTTALDALLGSVEEQFHRQATMRLAELNGWTDIPRVTRGDTDDLDLEVVSQFILRTSQAGAEWFDDDEDGRLMDRLRVLAGVDAEHVVEGVG